MQPSPYRPQVAVLISHLRRTTSSARLAQVVQQVLPNYAARARIQVIDAALADVLQVARELEQANGVDVFVCTGATSEYLRKHLSTPVLSMRVGGRDLLRALDQARVLSRDVAILSYPQVSAELDRMGPLFTVRIRQGSYTTLDEARAAVQTLVADGCRVIIGSSLVVELAQQAGVEGVLTLTADAVHEALDDALAICRSQRIEVAKRQQLNAVLQHLTDGVIAVDGKGDVQSINPTMARLLNVRPEWSLGRPVTEVAPGLEVENVLRTGAGEENRIIKIGNRTVIANLIPIHDDGVQAGGVLTCQEMTAVQRADRRIRSSTRPAHFTAKYRLDQISGSCEAIRKVIGLAERYALTDSTVLITGESGTGKELLAQGIHNAGRRRGGPFVPINCAAFPETLLESELFGYEEGAFSGSRKGGKAGLFEVAHTGTVFLDEIGDMPVSLQTRLLRVLQEREVLRLGGTEPTPVDIRVIAATHCDIRARIADGRFREDLFYRLNILRLESPPLRERTTDIPLIARKLLENLMPLPDQRAQIDCLLDALLPHLRAYRWPGNIRELENILERVALSAAHVVDIGGPDHASLQSLIPELFEGQTFIPQRDACKPVTQTADLRSISKVSEMAHIHEVLAASGGNIQKAAHRLGISRSTLWRRMRPAVAK